MTVQGLARMHTRPFGSGFAHWHCRKALLTRCSTDPPSMLYSLADLSSCICLPAKISLQQPVSLRFS